MVVFDNADFTKDNENINFNEYADKITAKQYYKFEEIMAVNEQIWNVHENKEYTPLKEVDSYYKHPSDKLPINLRENDLRRATPSKSTIKHSWLDETMPDIREGGFDLELYR